MADKLEVILNNDDLIDITEIMSKKDPRIGPARIEFLLKDAIRSVKGVDFFEEEIKQIHKDHENIKIKTFETSTITAIKGCKVKVNLS